MPPPLPGFCHGFPACLPFQPPPLQLFLLAKGKRDVKFTPCCKSLRWDLAIFVAFS